MDELQTNANATLDADESRTFAALLALDALNPEFFNGLEDPQFFQLEDELTDRMREITGGKKYTAFGLPEPE